MSEHDDKTIRDIFEQIRREDAAAAPSFAATLAAARRRQPTAPAGWRWRAVAPAAAAAMLVLAAAIWLWPSHDLVPGEAPLDDAVSVADWIAPSTAFLGLEDLGLLELGAAELVDSGSIDDKAWSFPSDTLMEQTKANFGQEREL